MDNLLTVTLEAHNPVINCHRQYEIMVGRDLLDAWTVSIRYGRIGGGCQTQCFSGTDETHLRSIIRERLLRRRSASSRIGCAYQVTRLDAQPGFGVEGWLPDDVIPLPTVFD